MPLKLAGLGGRFGLTAAFLALVFLLGGSGRDDVLSLVFLRPLSVLALAASLYRFPREAWREHRLLIAIALSLPVLALLQLIPLPPALWTALPGRELARAAGEAAGIGEPWRPLSLVPYRTWNSFWSFMAPLAALFLVLGLRPDQFRKLTYVIGLIALASGVLDLLQAIGAPGNGFYLYRVTNDDSAVGLFANRNHQAMMLAIAFAVLAACAALVPGPAETARPKRWLALGAAVMLLPFLLVTQSRAGLVVGAVGALAAIFVYRVPRGDQQKAQQGGLKLRWILMGTIAVGLLAATAFISRVSSVQRLFTANAGDDLRLQVWGPIARTVWDYFPAGSGLGTFVEVYKIAEPDRSLSPLYLNHAHNDFLELALTGGLPALLIVLAAAIYLVVRIVRAVAATRGEWSQEKVLVRLSAAIILILALGSTYDYPLRVPSLACLFAVAVGFLARVRRA